MSKELQSSATNITAARTLVGDSIGFFLGMTMVGLYGAVGAYLRSLLELSTMELVMLLSIPALAGTIMRVPFGAWVDLNGGRKPFIILLILAMLGVTCAGVVMMDPQSYGRTTLLVLIVLSAVMAGAGIATFPVGFAQLHYLSDRKEYGSLISAYGGIGTLGPGVTALVVPIFLIHFPLYQIYFCWGGLIFVGLIIYIFMSHSAPYFTLLKQGGTPATSREQAEKLGQQRFPQQTMWESVTRAMHYSRMWTISGLYFCSFGFQIALITLFPFIWMRIYGLDFVIGGLLGGAFGLIVPMMRVLAGQLLGAQFTFGTNRFGLTMIIVSALGLAFSPTIGLSLLCTLSLAIGMGLVNASLFNFLPRHFTEAFGGVIGWIGAFGIGGAFVFSLIWGALVKAYGNEGCIYSFLVIAGMTMLAWIADEWMRDNPQPKNNSKKKG